MQQIGLLVFVVKKLIQYRHQISESFTGTSLRCKYHIFSFKKTVLCGKTLNLSHAVVIIDLQTVLQVSMQFVTKVFEFFRALQKGILKCVLSLRKVLELLFD